MDLQGENFFALCRILHNEFSVLHICFYVFIYSAVKCICLYHAKSAKHVVTKHCQLIKSMNQVGRKKIHIIFLTNDTDQ